MSYIWMFVLQRSFLWPDSYTGIFPRRATAKEYKKAVIWLSGHIIIVACGGHKIIDEP